MTEAGFFTPAPGSAAVAPMQVVVVGAGPGGLAAALAAARAGAAVQVLDAAPAAGGQIWRARRGVAVPEVARRLRALEAAGVPVRTGTRVAMPLPGRELLVEGPDGARRVPWRRLVLATGARERLLPFPGWTLPGVFGAGGLQALVKGGWPIAGKRVVVAGSGPLLLAAAATLRREGAQVVALLEEAPAAALRAFAPALLRQPRKALEALRLGVRLLGVPSWRGAQVIAAQGEGRVERVVVRTSSGTRVIACDALAVGWGLLPQTELAEALGCTLAPRFGARAILVGADQGTSVPGIFAIGECTGVAGVRAAVLAGEVAGAAAASGWAPAAPERALVREMGFAAAVAHTFPVPPGWRERLADDTLVCRCEDVRWDALRDEPDLRSAKLSTRCGMGHCQGRLCHDVLANMMGADRLPARPPALPIGLGALLAIGPDGGAGTVSNCVPAPPEETSR